MTPFVAPKHRLFHVPPRMGYVFQTIGPFLTARKIDSLCMARERRFLFLPECFVLAACFRRLWRASLLAMPVRTVSDGHVGS